MDNMLEILWKPATDIKPEELRGKQCRNSITKEPIIVEVCEIYEGHAIVHLGGRATTLEYKLIEYIDESPEAVKELLKEYRKSANAYQSIDPMCFKEDEFIEQYFNH